MVFTAPALFLGLGARVLLDLFTSTDASSSPARAIFLGAWLGVGLHYTFTSYPDFTLFAGVAILACTLIDFNVSSDYTRSTYILLGVAVGALCTDALSQIIDPRLAPASSKQTRQRDHRAKKHLAEERRKLFQNTIARDTSQIARDEAFRQQLSDITSIDSNSELLRMNRTMTPLEREVAALRARASLADSERRRYKEEKKWAVEQGNPARASQMRWQVKKYTALMQSFNRQADEQLIEATRNSLSHNSSESGSSRARQDSSRSHEAHPEYLASNTGGVNIDISTKRRPVRVQVT